MRIHLYLVPAVVGMLAVGLSFAAEKKIGRSELPAAVEKTVQEQSVGATVKGFVKDTTGGKTEYEVEMTINGLGKDVVIATDGAVLEVEEELPQSAVPSAVLQALTKLAKGGKIVKVESLKKHDKIVSYEATVTKGARKHEIAVDPDGKSLHSED